MITKRTESIDESLCFRIECVILLRHGDPTYSQKIEINQIRPTVCQTANCLMGEYRIESTNRTACTLVSHRHVTCVPSTRIHNDEDDGRCMYQRGCKRSCHSSTRRRDVVHQQQPSCPIVASYAVTCKTSPSAILVWLTERTVMVSKSMIIKRESATTIARSLSANRLK